MSGIGGVSGNQPPIEPSRELVSGSESVKTTAKFANLEKGQKMAEGSLQNHEVSITEGGTKALEAFKQAIYNPKDS